MAATKVACPACRTALVANLPESSGMKVQCSRCGTMFTLPVLSTAPLPVSRGATSGYRPSTIGQPAPAVTVRPPLSAGPRRVAEAPPIVADGPRVRWAVLAAVGVVALLLTAGTGLVAHHLWTTKKSSEVQAQNEQKDDADQDSPIEPLPLTPLDEKAQKADNGDRRRDSPESGRPRQPAPDDARRPRRALTSLPEAEQRKVNDAIDRGVVFVKKQLEDGARAMHPGHDVGYVALPGLTLLECGVPGNDPVIRKAADLVRKGSANLQLTYDLALAILFLDRLGEGSDRDLIRTLAVRLVAGQRGDGGWTYTCPVLNAQDDKALFAILEEKRPASPAELFQAIENDKPGKPPAPKRPKKEKPGPKGKPPANFQNLPALQDKLAVQGDHGADNSNSQFALLALWTAQRHGVPVERSLALVVQRYRGTQNQDGGWGYHPRNPTTPAMTCVGLLGLAVGHGFRDGETKADSVRDPSIEKAMNLLSRNVGKPTGRDKGVTMGNLYFLWSLERVAVLYDLAKIGDKDWYAWGAEMLVASQRADGSWFGVQYPGGNTIPIDTCFALLFLKRANFVKDLTRKIEFLRIDAAPQK
jgi:hypothetical protein